MLRPLSITQTLLLRSKGKNMEGRSSTTEISLLKNMGKHIIEGILSVAESSSLRDSRKWNWPVLRK